MTGQLLMNKVCELNGSFNRSTLLG